MLPSTCSREVLLACPPPLLLGICHPSLWSPLFPPHAFALIPLSLAKVQPSPTLTLSPLVIWYSGQTALFLFLLAKAAPAYLPTAVSVALRPLFPSQQAQYVQVLLLKPVTSLLLSDSRPVFTTLSSPSFLLPETFWQIWQKLSFLSGYNGFLDTRFSRGMMWLMSWPDGECTCTLCNSLLSLSSSLWYPLLSFLGLEAHCLI